MCVKPAGRGFSPLDEALALIPGRLSPALAGNVAHLGVAMPFAQACGVLARLSGVHLSQASLRRTTLALGQATDAVEAGAVAVLEEGQSAALAGPRRQQVSVDGAMLPLVGGTWGEVRTVTVATLVPAAKRGEADRANALSYFSRLTDAANFTRLATLETHRRGTSLAGEVAAVNDGAEWIQEFVDTHCPNAVRILDWSHAAAYVHAVGHALDDSACGAWCQSHLSELREGEPANVLVHLRALLEELPLSHPARAQAVQSIGYLSKRLPQLQYRAFIAASLPIGSGIAESANKLVPQARCKGAGMHWLAANINSILALRCALLSGRWDATLAFAIAQLRLEACNTRQLRHIRRRPRRPRPIRPPRIQNGRPTPHHPWKRFPAVSPKHAKL